MPAERIPINRQTVAARPKLTPGELRHRARIEEARQQQIRSVIDASIEASQQRLRRALRQRGVDA